MKKEITTVREKNEIAKLNLDTAVLTRKLKILAEYDAVKTNTKRRQPVAERKSEDQIYNMQKRQKGANLGRDLERNYSPAKGILHQFRENVVGSLVKLQVNIKDGKEATDWFNGVWAKDCDYRDNLHFSTVLQNVVASVMREGDLLAVVDDGPVADSGKLLHWEADQIVPLSETALKQTGYSSAMQENGVLRGKYGEVLAYICTGKRGLTVLDVIKDATIWPREQARLVKNPWRLNQGRGVPSIITSANNFQDLYEILSKELQSAKVAAGQYATVKRKNAVTDWDSPALHPELLPENTGKTADETADETASSVTGATAPNYDKLESFTGGYVDYLDEGDDVEIPDIKRPNIHLLDFCEAVLGHAGASVGLARAYTILRAESSYTAFRGDMILSWVTFRTMQKWLERTYADWVAVKVLNWAQKKKVIKPLAVGWERTLSWLWPAMPAVNELEEEKGKSEALKNATTDYGQLWGPDWRRHMEALAEQLNVARELQLPLSVFEQKSGGVAPSEAKSMDSDEENPKKQKEKK